MQSGGDAVQSGGADDSLVTQTDTILHVDDDTPVTPKRPHSPECTSPKRSKEEEEAMRAQHNNGGGHVDSVCAGAGGDSHNAHAPVSQTPISPASKNTPTLVKINR